MTQAIDLSNLHDLTGGDPDILKEFLESFFESMSESLEVLKINVADQSTFSETSHAIKGMALTLGANHLAELAAEGQNNTSLDQAQRQQLFEEISAAYTSVKEYCKNL